MCTHRPRGSSREGTGKPWLGRWRCPSEQVPALLHEIHWVLVALLVVAPLPEQLHVVVRVRASTSQGDDVIEMEVRAERLFAACAFALLQRHQLRDDVLGQDAATADLPSLVVAVVATAG